MYTLVFVENENHVVLWELRVLNYRPVTISFRFEISLWRYPNIRTINTVIISRRREPRREPYIAILKMLQRLNGLIYAPS